MEMTKIVEKDMKGNILLPKNIFGKPKSKDSNKFIIVSGDDYIILKKITSYSAKQRFNNVSKKIQKKFKERGIAKDDVDKAIKWARKSK